MKPSNIVIGCLAVAALAVGVVVVEFSRTNAYLEKSYQDSTELNAHLSKELQKVKDELSIYRNRLHDSEAQLHTLNEKLLAVKNNTFSSDEDAFAKAKQQESFELVETEKNSESVVPEDQSAEEVLLAFARRVRSGESPDDIEKSIRKKFDEEEVDGSWAYDYETNIRDLVAADQDNNFNIQELSCRTSACEMKIVANESNAMLLGALFSKKIGEQQWRDKNAAVIFNHQVKDGVMSILIARDKNSLNF